MSRSFVVALVVPDITNALFPPIVRGAERVLARAGYTLVLTDTNNDPDTERSQISAMRARGVDGFIIATARWVDPVVSELAESGIPTVLVNRRDAVGPLPYVGGDDRHGMQLCVEHLADLGHSTILHLAGPNNTSTGRERTAAFRTGDSRSRLRGRLGLSNARLHRGSRRAAAHVLIDKACHSPRSWRRTTCLPSARWRRLPSVACAARTMSRSPATTTQLRQPADAAAYDGRRAAAPMGELAAARCSTGSNADDQNATQILLPVEFVDARLPPPWPPSERRPARPAHFWFSSPFRGQWMVSPPQQR